MADIQKLHANINERFSHLIENSKITYGELTIEVIPDHLREICFGLRDDAKFDFKLLLDVCGVDFLQYGISEWQTDSASESGFERGVEVNAFSDERHLKHRFASVYHLLSIGCNQRIRIRVFLDEKQLEVPSVQDIWPAANWFERESFDLLGIIYQGHPDLRRILTDYGFIGHPFRKDFPLIGNLEARYDAVERRVIYEPVSIQPRILEPKVIRTDPRYKVGE